MQLRIEEPLISKCTFWLITYSLLLPFPSGLDSDSVLGRLVLNAVVLPKLPSTRQEFVVRALLDDFALFQHHNLICVLDSREPMSNGDHGSVFHKPFQRLLYKLLRHAFDCGDIVPVV